jgi:hypothetical protein
MIAPGGLSRLARRLELGLRAQEGIGRPLRPLPDPGAARLEHHIRLLDERKALHRLLRPHNKRLVAHKLDAGELLRSQRQEDWLQARRGRDGDPLTEVVARRHPAKRAAEMGER